MILVDSDVLIAHLRGVTAARQWLIDARSSTGPLAISALSITEISGGMRSSERSEVWRLLNSFRVESVTEAIARRGGEYMREYRASHHTISIVDYIIAATAHVRALELATLNIRHFPMFNELHPPFAL